ncbi:MULTISPECIES: phosphopantetheine-binding protein [Rhodococcus]|uniref:phosphopantetheine-binding protein n=1 Tax=Rhodococcus TaxID=1827 RepID=UPI0009EE938E|nr:MULTISPECIES: phosphopantetheine-binding protein [Rhodococcus]MCD2116035.1 phosphopantetheine-binding protein [Rhodococcus pyridinivorans]MCW3469032.1 phosphopantetheine-binding protein [Rhodococcus pyridinivorans]MCZ4624899.1 phosphopantetheine-binding protein [Rhodococcus pyridinivorans]MCZ4646109.1 phosphopantetheine-binding protein [Rhodococcus pyridinivorans]MDJ0482831.1 phosphopantetheine-binding protein [Rhodococcus pyridinivorans]
MTNHSTSTGDLYEGIAAEFGTPVYIFRAESIEQAVADLRAALPGGSEIYFSLKANPNSDVGAILRAAGCRAEISSVGELAAALAAGFDPAEALYTGPGKTEGEIGTALDAGVRNFSCESVRDLRRVASAAERRSSVADCLLRVNAPSAPGQGAMRMTGTPSQFGIDLDSVEVLPMDLVIAGARVHGFHFYPMSNATDEDALIEEIVNSIRYAVELSERWEIPLEVLDLGGGFAAPYGVEGSRPLYPSLRESVEFELDRRLPGWREGNPKVVFESGRYLTCDSGTLVARVLDVKRSRDKDFVVTDTGIHHVGGLSGIGRVLPMRASAALGPSASDGAPAAGAVVGPLCTPADVLNRHIEFGDIAPGRIISVPNVGAYGLSASLMGFLSRPAPVEVVTRGQRVVAASRVVFAREEVSFVQENKSDQEKVRNWDEHYETMLRSVLPRLDAAAEITPHETLQALGIDSLALVHLLGTVEAHYAVTVPDEALFDGRCDTPLGLWEVIRSQAGSRIESGEWHTSV